MQPYTQEGVCLCEGNHSLNEPIDVGYVKGIRNRQNHGIFSGNPVVFCLS